MSHICRVPSLNLSSGYCIYVLTMSMWVSSWFSSFLQPPKNMSVGGLVTLGVNEWVSVCVCVVGEVVVGG